MSTITEEPHTGEYVFNFADANYPRYAVYDIAALGGYNAVYSPRHSRSGRSHRLFAYTGRHREDTRLHRK